MQHLQTFDRGLPRAFDVLLPPNTVFFIPHLLVCVTDDVPLFVLFVRNLGWVVYYVPLSPKLTNFNPPWSPKTQFVIIPGIKNSYVLASSLVASTVRPSAVLYIRPTVPGISY